MLVAPLAAAAPAAASSGVASPAVALPAVARSAPTHRADPRGRRDLSGTTGPAAAPGPTDPAGAADPTPPETPKRAHYLWVVAGEVATISVVQLVPMFLLPVLDYAVFSAIYLGFAVCLALKYALLSDVWARQLRRESPTAALLHTFQATLTMLALVSGLIVGALSGALTSGPLLGALAGIAVAAAVFRAGVSYRLIALGQVRRDGLSGLGGALLGAAAMAILWPLQGLTATSVLLCWAAVSLGASVLAATPPAWDLRSALSWVRSHSAEIRLITGDALIKNIESVGTPFLLGGIGGAIALALHRAGSSLTYPVRLIVDVLRARIISGAISRSWSVLLPLIGLGAIAGAAATVGLRLLVDVVPQDSVIVLLADHAIAVGVWILVTALSSYLQFAGRGSFHGRRLLLRRIAHTVVVLGVTVGGVLVFGVPAVIWAAALAHIASVPLWIPLPGDRAQPGDPAPPSDPAQPSDQARPSDPARPEDRAAAAEAS